MLVGTVRRADGSPVVGTGVTLRAVADGGPVPEVAVVTDANGRYEVTARLVPGVYEAAAAVDGMFGTATALVQEGEGPARADVVVPSSS